MIPRDLTTFRVSFWEIIARVRSLSRPPETQ